MSAVTAGRMDAEGRGANNGWIAGFLVILAVLAVGAVLWFSHHP
ncbi:MAG TPA: hypothetical protein VMG14_03960 [Thermoplasmata archaeon]|nr:hypothetical protein [Thermoplasmata archaeon]